MTVTRLRRKYDLRPPSRDCIIGRARACDSTAQSSSISPTGPSHETAAATMALSIDQKRLKATKFPPEFDRKVDIEKVNIDLMKKWIAQKITDILGDEDDIVVETCYNLIEQNQFVRTDTRLATRQPLTCPQPKIKEIQIQLTGFLNKDTPAFCKELWDLMLSAQESPMGVPKEMLEAKKLELQQEQVRDSKRMIQKWCLTNSSSPKQPPSLAARNSQTKMTS